MKTNSIELVLPLKAEYVSIARLTASGVASRIGFDIEAVEDIKVAISEVCSKLVSAGDPSGQNCRIVFELSPASLQITFFSEDQSLRGIFDDSGDELGISILTALMDEIDFCPGKNYLLSMTKSLEENGANGRE